MAPVKRRRLATGARLLVVSVLACAVGIAAGLGASILRGADSSSADDRASVAATPSRTSTAPASAAIRVRLLGAVLHPAASPDAIARKRARVSVRAQLTNTSARAMTIAPPRLMSGRHGKLVDRHAAAAAGALLEPIAPRASAEGVLRFEIAGELTRRVTSMRRAALRIGGRTLWVPVVVGAPARRSR